MAVAWDQFSGQSTAGLTDEDLRGLQDLGKNGVAVETRRAANAGGASKAPCKRPRAEFRPLHGRRFYKGCRPSIMTTPIATSAASRATGNMSAQTHTRPADSCHSREGAARELVVHGRAQHRSAW